MVGGGSNRARAAVAIAVACTALAFVTAAPVGATVASTAAPTTGSLHVVYKAEGTTEKHSNANDETTNGTQQVNWTVTADIPLKSRSTVPYRYSTNGSGPVTANGTYQVVTSTGATLFDCSGPLEVAPTDAQDVATFELDFAKSGGKLTSKATLYSDSPVPLGSGEVGAFTASSGTGCATETPIGIIPLNSPPKGPKALATKVDLAQIAAAKNKTKTYTVGDTDSVTASDGATTKWNWDGTITLTLTK